MPLIAGRAERGSADARDHRRLPVHRQQPALHADQDARALALSGAAIGVAVAIAIRGGDARPLHRGSFLAQRLERRARAAKLAVISIGLGFLAIGFINVMVALVILAVPPMLTNAYVAVHGVDPDAVEGPWRPDDPRQVLEGRDPLAVGLMFAGIRTGGVRRGRRRRSPRSPGVAASAMSSSTRPATDGRRDRARCA